MAKAKKQTNNSRTKAMAMTMARQRPRPRIVARKSEPPSNLFLKKKMNDMAEGIQTEAKPIPSNPDPDVVYSRSATPCLIPDDDDVHIHIPKHGKCEYEPVASSPPSTPCHLGFPEPFNCRPPEPIFYSNATPPSASSSPDSATSPFYYDCPPSPPTGFGFRSHCAPLQQQEYWDSYSDPESVGSSFSPCHWANLAAA